MLSGTVKPGFEPIARELERQLKKRGGGSAVCAYHEGECVIDMWGGIRDEDGSPWERDTMSVSYSTTKGVVTTAFHMCVDRGLIDYEDRVAQHWPEFAQAGKGGITVRDVLCHRAGMFNIRDLVDDASRMLDWDYMVEALAAASSAHVPEKATAYQALTYGYLVGELIRRVSGKTVAEFLRDEIAAPLELDGLYIGAPPDALQRASKLLNDAKPKQSNAVQSNSKSKASGERARRRRARMYNALEWALHRVGHPVDFERSVAALAPKGIANLDFSSHDVLAACIPAANGLFTARSLARMYAALAAGGKIDDTRLLSPETLARATEIQSNGYDQITVFKMRWRLGYHRVATFRGVPKRAFGHFGWGGSGAWADPTRNISLGFVVNTGSGTPIGDMRIMRLNTALLSCAKKQYKRRRKAH